MTRHIAAFLLVPALLLSGVALAHQGVQNPAVLARMEGMKAIAEATKTLGLMARGEITFDADAAHVAAGEIAEAAGRIEAQFVGADQDPASESLPVIWDRFPEFVNIAGALENAARNTQSISAVEELTLAMQAIGGTCRDCHRTFRKPD